MKRNLIIFAIICFSLILFTGCDEILEAFYPAFGEAKNEIYIIVDIDESIVIGSETPIMVGIIPIKDGQLAIGNMWAQDHYDRHIEADFFPLPGGDGAKAYKVLVWQDANNNGKLEQEEPSIQVRHGDGWYMDDLFDFRTPPGGETPPDYIEANAYLNNWDKIDYAIIQQFENYVPGDDGGGEVGEYTDFSFQIEGPFTISKENAPDDAIYKIRPASDVPIISYYVEMWSPDGQSITFNPNETNFPDSAPPNPDNGIGIDPGRKEIHIDFNAIDFVGDNNVTGLSDTSVPNDMRLYLEIEYDEDGDEDGDVIGYGEFVIHFTTSEDEATVDTLYTLNIELERLGDEPLILAADQSYPCLAVIMQYDDRTGNLEFTETMEGGTIDGGFGYLEIPNILYQTPEHDFVRVYIWNFDAGEDDLPAWVSEDISIYLGKEQVDASVSFGPRNFHEMAPFANEGDGDVAFELPVGEVSTGKTVGDDGTSYYAIPTVVGNTYEISFSNISTEIYAYVYAYDGPSLSYWDTSDYDLAYALVEPSEGTVTFQVTPDDDYVIFMVDNYGGGGSYDIEVTDLGF